MGWNKNYLIALQNVKPINGLNIDTTETLNVILDKINEVGLDNLTATELKFLDTFDY